MYIKWIHMPEKSHTPGMLSTIVVSKNTSLVKYTGGHFFASQVKGNTNTEVHLNVVCIIWDKY